MAASPSSPVALEPKPQTAESENPVIQSSQQDLTPSVIASTSSSSPSSLLPSSPSSSSVVTATTTSAVSGPPAVAENPNFNPPVIIHPPTGIHSFSPSTISAGAIPPSAPSFRLMSTIPMPTQQFSPLPNPNMQNPYFQSSNIQNPNVQPPGVNPVPSTLSGVSSVAGGVTVSVSPSGQVGLYQVPPGQPPNPAVGPYAQMPNGYPIMSTPSPLGMIPPQGIPRYPTPYMGILRPPFPPRPLVGMGMLPPLSRPPVPGIRVVPPIITPVARPVIPIVAATEKPQTTVYVGKISSTVENDFMLSLLRLCGPVKSWKRAQDPTDGTPRGFGFCEFESAEGVLRALRLLSKFGVDGQELVLNVNQATREYLERYVEKKSDREKNLKESETEGAEKEKESAPGVEKNGPPKPSVEDSKQDENSSVDKDTQDSANFGIVTDEDREADRDALEKLTRMIEERIKTKPLPPPPPPPPQTPANGSEKSNSEVPTKSRDGDSDVDIMQSDVAEEKNDDETTSENKATSERHKSEITSPDRSRRHDRRSRDKDRERREKERELERYERERERERSRREREREMKIREAERLYKERVKEWESREREKEYQRQHEKDREKERERERRREILDQEDDSDDEDMRKRRRRSSVFEEKRKKRQREKEEDLADRLREEEEIVEAKRRATEEKQKQKDYPKLVSIQVTNTSEKPRVDEPNVESRDNATGQAYESDTSNGKHEDDTILRNNTGDETSMISTSDTRNGSNAPSRKLGFGLVGSGRRTSVPSVFHEEDDDDAEDKKMRTLVPIDYSKEELQATDPTFSGAPPPNLAAAAEFAKRISNVNPKDEKAEVGKERSWRSNERSSERDRGRDDDESSRGRGGNREKTRDQDMDREHGPDKVKTLENKKLLDAKQLIDMIPKTKDELFSYDINWAIYDKYEIHERMRPWISKKITEFLGEEEATLVEYIVSSTKEHVRASQMLELLQSILDDEAEMFVLKMWRMLIFEIKKVETGLPLKPKA